MIIGAELGGAAGARAPPVLHNPRKFIVARFLALVTTMVTKVDHSN